MTKLYTLQDCTVRIDGNEILRPTSLHIKEGDFSIITGPSGAGKSTLLQVLLGFQAIHSGVIQFRGEDLCSKSLHKMRKEVAVVFQEPTFMGETVLEVLLTPFSYKKNKIDQPSDETISQEIEAVGLEIEASFSKEALSQL